MKEFNIEQDATQIKLTKARMTIGELLVIIMVIVCPFIVAPFGGFVFFLTHMSHPDSVPGVIITFLLFTFFSFVLVETILSAKYFSFSINKLGVGNTRFRKNYFIPWENIASFGLKHLGYRHTTAGKYGFACVYFSSKIFDEKESKKRLYYRYSRYIAITPSSDADTIVLAFEINGESDAEEFYKELCKYIYKYCDASKEINYRTTNKEKKIIERLRNAPIPDIYITEKTDSIPFIELVKFNVCAVLLKGQTLSQVHYKEIIEEYEKYLSQVSVKLFDEETAEHYYDVVDVMEMFKKYYGHLS